MGINKNKITGLWDVTHYKRHPITRVPVRAARKGIKSEREARRIEQELVIQVEDKLRRAIKPTWEKVLFEYLAASQERGLRNSTLYQCGSTLKAHTSAWNPELVDSITTDQIRKLIYVQLSDKAESHKKYVLKCIRAVFSYALEAGYINRNPSPKMVFKLGDKIKQVLTADQARHLLYKAKEAGWDWYFHYALALYTGMRNGELYALTWDKVDLDSRLILVNCSWNKVDGLKSTKSGDDRRVEIAKQLLPILHELKRYWTGSDHVLPRLNKWDKGEQSRELRMFLQGIGMQPIRFHDLRATWATMLLSNGVEPIKVMKMGGWKDIETMMIYARKAGVDIKGATDCLNLHSEGGKVLSLPKLGSR
jgi:integrase